MADTKTTQKYRINRVVDANGNLVVVHPETEAGQVLYSSTIGQTTVTNVDQALGALTTLAQNSGVTGVKGSAENTYRTGDVNLTPANIGAVASNSAITPLTTQTVVKLTYDSKGLVTGSTGATLDDIVDGTTRKIPTDYIPTSQKGANNGVATLTAEGKVPTSQLPSYVDDVVEYASKSGFPTTGIAGQIYVAKDTNLTYRWGGTDYVEISASLALGETSSTAYAGDKGKQNADNIVGLTNAFEEIIRGDTSVGFAEDANALGGVSAEQYALKTDVPAEAVFVVTFDINYTAKTCTSNKTYNQIQQAISAGKTVYGKDSDGNAYQLTSINCDSTLEFSRIGAYGVGLHGTVIYLDGEDDPWFTQTTVIEAVEDTGISAGAIITEIKKKSEVDGTISVTRRAMTNDDLPTPQFQTSHALYSAVRVNSKGIVTAGGNSIEWGTSSNNAPSEALMLNGLFFELVE